MKNIRKKNSPTAIRATFSVPHEAMIEIESIRDKLGLKMVHMNKSEIVRLALSVLMQQTDKTLVLSAKTLPRFKAGRPKRDL